MMDDSISRQIEQLPTECSRKRCPFECVEKCEMCIDTCPYYTEDGVKELTERMNGLAENVGHALGIMSKQVEDLTQKVEALSGTVDLQPTCNQLATDCISRQAAIDFIDTGRLCNPNEPRWSDNEIVNFLKSRPSADRPKGMWVFDTQIPIGKGAYSAGYRCSICEKDYFRIEGMNFCPNCGAKMVREDGEA